MAHKSSAGNGMNLLYRDLTSEVTRRLLTMTAREEILTKKSDEAREMVWDSDFKSDSVQVSPLNMDYPVVPPAPPPSPAEDSTSS
ncbi:myocilin opposite strand protein [Choloepus didactylus]|uniref:myocilin opposite strand protein n=1 Tax=Choloepus didactylus TaxID=27675 RepID=UPI00189DA1EA|nr:myocilin opposite strand protein [Choloepus didactylus]